MLNHKSEMTSNTSEKWCRHISAPAAPIEQVINVLCQPNGNMLSTIIDIEESRISGRTSMSDVF